MRKFEYAVLGIVLFLALFLRFYNLDWETFGHGEMEVYQSVGEFLKGNFVHNFYIFNETPLGKYIFTLFAYLFSPDEVAMRFVSVIFGSLAVLFVYLFTRRLYTDRWTPLIAATITAFSILHLQFSRYVQLEAELSLAYLLFFYAFWEFLHRKTNRNAVLLGITGAFGLLLKTAFINAILTVIVLILIHRLISFKLRPNFSVIVDNKILKAFVVFILCFFLLWPVALIPLHADITVDVEDRVNHISADIPTFLLVFGYRFTEVNKGIADNALLGLPVLGYMLFFAVRENLLFVLLFIIGLFVMYKEKLEQDKYVILIIFIFLITLWAENMRITYRYVAIIVPFLSIVAARSAKILAEKARKLSKKLSHDVAYGMIFIIVFIVMLINAISASPSYALYYNDIQKILQLPDHEAFQSEGLGETIYYLKQNCPSTFTSNHYRIMIENYYSNISSSSAFDATCVVTGIDPVEGFDYSDYMKDRACTQQKTVTRNSIELIKIYRC